MGRFAKWLFGLLCSLKLAVGVLVALAAALAAATFLESATDARTAQYFVYRASWFNGLLGLLATIIACVMVSRWPWRRSHLPFLLAHAGILILLGGSFATQRYGIDGTIRLREGTTNSAVELDECTLYASDRDSVRSHRVEWVPNETRFRPFDLALLAKPEAATVRISRFLPHADARVHFEPWKGSRDFAVHLAVKGGPMRLSERVWLWTGDPGWSELRLGPALIRALRDRSPASAREPGPFLAIWREGVLTRFESRSSRGERVQGLIEKGRGFDPHWKGVRIEVLDLVQNARSRVEYLPSKSGYGDSAPPSAILLETAEGAATWLGLGDRASIEVGGQSIDVGYFPRRLILPFGIRLERFTIDHYPGTRDPKEFSSLVRLAEKNELREGSPVKISMNQPMTAGGLTFYQSSYVPAEPRPVESILSVNRDPGRPAKYLGAFLIVLGSAWLFVSKRLAARAAAIALTLASLAGIWARTAEASEVAGASPLSRPGWSYAELGLAPVRSGGRVKPLDTFARETVLFVTGSRKHRGMEPLETLLSWVAASPAWDGEAFIQLNRRDAKLQLGLDAGRSRFSPRELIRDTALVQYLEASSHPTPSLVQANDPTRAGASDPRLEEIRRAASKISAFRAIASGEGWPVGPGADADSPWRTLADLAPEKSPIAAGFRDLLKAFASGDEKAFLAASRGTREAIELAARLDAQVTASLEVEHFYHRLHPYQWAWVLEVAAFLLLLVSRGLPRLGRTSRSADALGLSVAGAGCAFLLAGMALRMRISGRPPVTNMYESVIWVAFGSLVFAGLVSWIQKGLLPMVVGTGVATLALLVADASPTVLDPSIQPLVPVLRSNLWLTVHVLTITLSYAAFALAWGLGNASLVIYLARGDLGRLKDLNQLTYRAMQFGVVFLAAGTILGGVWADYSWGRFWGWDPKETWALIALLFYLAILHARYTGWVGAFGFPVLAVAGFLSVLMAWYGVNFVLGVGLHSYGFSSGGFGAVGGFVLLECAFLFLVSWRRVGRATQSTGSWKLPVDE